MRNRHHTRCLLLSSVCACVIVIGSGAANAQPAGASVAIGTASVSQADAANTIITQSSDKALINWQNFSVDAGANVIFRQPNASAITLNRVLGPGASSIDGNLLANGQVWLINPNGILFGKTSTINVGAILATTSDIGDGDFASGNYDFRIASGNPNASIINQGSIHANSVVLASQRVANDGLIEANLGNVVLAGANTFALDFTGDNLIRFAITSGEGKAAQVSNAGAISAAGGKVLLTARAARDVVDNVINTSGMIEAKSVSVQNGVIILDAGDGTVNVSGTLDASGGQVEETGGAISVLGRAVAINDGARLDVSGDSGGGTILVGGNVHGATPEHSAETVSVGSAVLSADAISVGNGGKVVLWSDMATDFAGQISAKGGAKNGDGGFVETSGGTLAIAPLAKVTASAANGASGTWLLDPKFITIANGGGISLVGSDYGSSPASSMTIDPITIVGALEQGTNVLLEANTDLTVTDTISAAATASGTELTFHAGRSILINASIDVGNGTVNLVANDANALAAHRDAGAGSIVAGSGVELTASAVNLLLSNGGNAGTIGSAATPIGIDTDRVSVKTFGADVYLNSPDKGLVLGTMVGDVDVGNGRVSISANGSISIPAAVSAGKVLLASGANIFLSGAGSITASGSGDAIVLSVGNVFQNTTGVEGLNLTGGGRWLVFSQEPGKILGGSLTASPFYNRAFDFTDNSYASIASTGNRFVYALAPVLTVTANDTTRAYGASDPAFAATITGLISGDSLADAVSGTPSFTTNATVNSQPGTTAPITPSLGTLVSDYNYGFTFVDGTLNITTGVLTAALTGTVSKVYDGTTSASLAAGNYTLSGLVPGDVVTLNNPSAGTYDNKNTGTSKIVDVSGLAISGADASKYTLSSANTSGAVGTITKAPLTAALGGSVSKIYDGTNAATLVAGNYALSGVVSGESVALNNPSVGSYNNKNAGTGKLVTVSGLALGGVDAGNYVLNSTSASASIGTITQAPLTASLSGTVAKTYDGTTVATLEPGDYTLSGEIGGDSVEVSNTTGTYDTKNVGTGKTVSVTGLTLSGTDAGNYVLTATNISDAMGVITKADVTASLTGTIRKTYDGTTIAEPDGFLLSGKIAGDLIALENPDFGTYDDKNVGTGKTVTVTGLFIDGPDAGNYNLSSATISAPIGIITKAPLLAELTGTVSKVYNGTTAATLSSSNYILWDVIPGDSVVLNNPVSGIYDSKNVGTHKTVSASDLAISGADSSNYVLSSTSVSGAIGTITQAPLTAALSGTVAKVYDGTTTTTLGSENYTLDGLIVGDSVALNSPSSGTYDTKNAGTGKAVSVSGLAISGADAGNYVLTSSGTSGSVGVIAKAPLTPGLTGSVSKSFDGTTAASLSAENYTLGGVLGSDSVSLNNPVSGTFDSPVVGTEKTVTVSGLALTGAAAGDYMLTATTASGVVGQITMHGVDPTLLTVFLPGTVSPSVAPLAVDVTTSSTPLIAVVDTNTPPLATLGGNEGNGGEVPTRTDSVTQSVGQSLDGSRRSAASSTAALLGGMLNTQIPTLPTNVPRGVPSADQDFSSWGNEALWQ